MTRAVTSPGSVGDVTGGVGSQTGGVGVGTGGQNGGVGIGVGGQTGGVGAGIGGQTGGVGVGIGGQNGGVGVGVGNPSGGVGVGVGGPSGGVGVGVGGPSGGIGVGAGNPTGGIDITIGPGGRAAYFKPAEVGGAAFSTRASDSGLGYARASAVVNRIFVRVSGRLGSLSRRNGTDIDEGLLRYRDEHYGDFQVGRFHWFPGPVSNGELGKLISFTTVDGALWRLPTGETNLVQLGYFARINSLRGPRVGGYTARWSLPIAQGRYGGSLLEATTRGSSLGYSGDIVYPVVRQQLELYGEAGRDTLAKGFLYHRRVSSPFPQPFQGGCLSGILVSRRIGRQFGNERALSAHAPPGRTGDTEQTRRVVISSRHRHHGKLLTILLNPILKSYCGRKPTMKNNFESGGIDRINPAAPSASWLRNGQWNDKYHAGRREAERVTA